jgi:hypothetical protein
VASESRHGDGTGEGAFGLTSKQCTWRAWNEPRSLERFDTGPKLGVPADFGHHLPDLAMVMNMRWQINPMHLYNVIRSVGEPDASMHNGPELIGSHLGCCFVLFCFVLFCFVLFCCLNLEVSLGISDFVAGKCGCCCCCCCLCTHPL